MNQPRMARHNTQQEGRSRIAPGLLILALFAGLLVGATEANAARSWCIKDPIFQVGPDIVDVTVASYSDMLVAATGPVRIELTVPNGVEFKLIHADNGFGYGYEITYAFSSQLKDADRSTQVIVAVYAPATDGSLPVRVRVRSTSGPKAIYDTTTTGSANAWVTVQTR